MAEEVVSTPEIVSPEAEHAAIVKANMAFAFQEQLPQEAAPIEEQGEPTPPPVETPVVLPPVAPSPLADDVSYLKENFGVESKDAIKAILQEYETLKKTATTPAEYKYANEEAKKLAHAINTGDYKTVRSYVEAQELNLEGMTDEQILKQHIKTQNPMFSSKHVEEEYAEMYSLNEDDIDESKIERERLKVEQRKVNDIQKAKAYFTEYKQKAQLPDIKQNIPDVDEAYESYKASTAKSAEDFNNVIAPAINALKASDLQMSLNVNDPANSMVFDLSVVVDDADFAKAKSSALDFGGYLEKNFYDEKGNFQQTKFVQAILRGDNFDKYAQTIARQAVNAERKRLMNAETPAPALQRNFTVPEEESVDPIKEHWKRAMAV